MIDLLSTLSAHLTWPMVASIYAPFILLIAWLKLGQLAKTAKNIKEILNSSGKLSEIVDDLKNIEESFSQFKNEYSIRNIEDDSLDIEKSSSTSKTVGISEIPVPDNVEERYSSALSEWESFKSIFEKKLKTSSKDYKLSANWGIAARILANKLKTPHLSENDIVLIGKLHSQYRSFVRTRATKKDWLTPDIYTTFVKGIITAKQKVEAVGTRNG